MPRVVRDPKKYTLKNQRCGSENKINLGHNMASQKKGTILKEQIESCEWNLQS